MFAIYQLDRSMSGECRKVAECDTWRGIINFIETYYSGYKALEEYQFSSLPVPKGDLEDGFIDVHGNVYVIYNFPIRYYDYPDIDKDYNDYYDSDGYSIDNDWPYEYDRFYRMISRSDFITEYLPDYKPISCADRKNGWYVGALHGI